MEAFRHTIILKRQEPKGPHTPAETNVPGTRHTAVYFACISLVGQKELSYGKDHGICRHSSTITS